MNKPKFDLTASNKSRTMRIIQEDERLVASLAASTTEGERNKYPESEFRRHFLPIVSGEAFKKLAPGYTAERLSEEATGYWMRIAGGPGHEVDVVEPDGTVAFTVPAVMDTSVLNISQPRHEAGLRALNAEYQNKIIGLPHVANDILNRGLSAKLTHLLSQDTDREGANKKIDEMRRYYNLPVDTATSSTSGQTTSSGDQFMGDMLFD